QIAQFREIFATFDADNDGTITQDELKVVMHRLGQTTTEDELREMIRKVNTNKNGRIDFDEFLRLMSNRFQNLSEGDEMEAAFHVFDRDGNGSISIEELELVLQSLDPNLTEQEIKKMMEEADLNGDGVISMDEFKKNNTSNTTGQQTQKDSSETTFTIQPHPATTNDPKDLQRNKEPGGGLQTSSSLFHGPGPVIPDHQMQQNIGEPLSREELHARAAELNK
ncbi:hypothetical protein C0993_002548, partial [Termitomyces sp. T159_Od127]